MISVLVYGRNDNYGYNLHRRAALSLNCLAAVLDGADDEILFVDYNTPDDLPTFPEAIADTLTPHARAILRILRVRAAIHGRYAGATPLAVLEPVARNVGLRRSNPANRWVLSTNTDMIVVPRDGRALSRTANDLPDGYYHLPRFELPQTLWEALDRRDPGAALARAAEWGRALHLDEIVHAEDDYIRYDGPGDFQLMLRADLFDIGGFDERILLGWHVDANIARRLFLKYLKAGSLAARLRGYHCEHTRQATPKHAPGRVADDIAAVAGAVGAAAIESQAGTWGLAADTIEEIRLGMAVSGYLAATAAGIGAPPDQPPDQPMNEPADMPADMPGHVVYGRASYDAIGYDARHVLPFLMDSLVSFPRDTWLGWAGGDHDLLRRAVAAWRALGFTRPVHVLGPVDWLGPALPDGASWCDIAALAGAARICVLDFGGGRPPGGGGRPTGGGPADGGDHGARRFVAEALRRLASAGAPCRVIAVNAVNTAFERLLASHCGMNSAPITTRLRQGFLLPRDGRRDLLPGLLPGPAGARAAGGGAIAIAAAQAGLVCHGPYLDLPPGRYRLSLTVEPAGAPTPPLPAPPAPLEIEVASRRLRLGYGILRSAAPLTLDFAVSPALPALRPSLDIEMLIRSCGPACGTLTAMTLECLGPPDFSGPAVADGWVEWLPALRVGLGERAPAAATVRALAGQPGHVVFGPYRTFLPGRHEVRFTLAVPAAPRPMLHRIWRPIWRPTTPRPTIRPRARLEVVAGSTVLAERDIDLGGEVSGEFGGLAPAIHVVAFTVAEDPADGTDLELRVWTDGSERFSILSVETREAQSG